MTKKDYYEILGVKKTDSEDTIKKSYKKLALKFHPDKAQADKKKEHEDKFKEINEAYSTLSDPEKKRKYDQGENQSSHQSYSSNGADLSEMLRDLLRGGAFGSSSSDDESEVDPNLYSDMTLEFKEAVFGCEKDILIKKDIFCEVCAGTGAENKEMETCQACDGQGRLKVNRRTLWGVVGQIIRCDECNGGGQIPKHKCKSCNGAGILKSQEKVKIKIPAGIDDGQTLRIKNAGNAIKNEGQGDLFLVMHVMQHRVFKREGFDIRMDLSISFSQAALGCEITIPTLSDEGIKIKIAKGTESGSILRLRGKGIKILNGNRFGDQFVDITVKTPKKLSKAQITLFEELAKLD